MNTRFQDDAESVEQFFIEGIGSTLANETITEF
jgi:hypothetical protein